MKLAASHGFTLTEDDFKPSEMEALTEDELEAVAGGFGGCGCTGFGGGGGGGLICGCMIYESGSLNGVTLDSDTKCQCIGGGAGVYVE